MSAQAEEVVAAAQSLAQMASTLDELVARFKLTQSEPESVVQRRRTNDWQAGRKVA